MFKINDIITADVHWKNDGKSNYQLAIIVDKGPGKNWIIQLFKDAEGFKANTDYAFEEQLLKGFKVLKNEIN